MSASDPELRDRIAALVDSVKGDRKASEELFQYAWTMVCVRRGLLRIVREGTMDGTPQIVVQEVNTGRHRVVARPDHLDPDVEALAVQALARMLGPRSNAS